MRHALVLGASILCAAAGLALAAPAPELGTVAWGRDLAAAQRLAAESGKPIFLLFQEVPGCQTCVGFGETVLSDPLTVEAIEGEFVPVAILNNKGGADREVLERFGEPAWNNPVVRFVDAAGVDVIPRRAGVWSRGGILSRMVATLERAGRPVPGYLQLLVAETSPGAERATFAMHCFWEGEACLGGFEGVLSTRPVFMSGSEAVEVLFDPALVSYPALLERARRGGCARQVFAHDSQQLATAQVVFGEAGAILERGPARNASDSDEKRHLRRTRYAKLDLTPLQRVRINAELASGGDPGQWLSPRQRAALTQ